MWTEQLAGIALADALPAVHVPLAGGEDMPPLEWSATPGHRHVPCSTGSNAADRPAPRHFPFVAGTGWGVVTVADDASATVELLGEHLPDG